MKCQACDRPESVTTLPLIILFEEWLCIKCFRWAITILVNTEWNRINDR